MCVLVVCVCVPVALNLSTVPIFSAGARSDREILSLSGRIEFPKYDLHFPTPHRTASIKSSYHFREEMRVYMLSHSRRRSNQIIPSTMHLQPPTRVWCTSCSYLIDMRDVYRLEASSSSSLPPTSKTSHFSVRCGVERHSASYQEINHDPSADERSVCWRSWLSC